MSKLSNYFPLDIQSIENQPPPSGKTLFLSSLMGLIVKGVGFLMIAGVFASLTSVLILLARDKYRLIKWKSLNKNAVSGKKFLEGILEFNLIPTIQEYIRHNRVNSLISSDSESLHLLQEFALNLEWALNNPKDILERSLLNNDDFSQWLKKYNLERQNFHKIIRWLPGGNEPALRSRRGIAAIGHDGLDDIYTLVDMLTKKYEENAP